MDLWIRSQDRAEILKCEKLLYIQVLNGNFHILNENEFPLGIYETRERALEVLNEIQNRILNLQIISITGNITSKMKKYDGNCVYDMPKE